MQLKDVEQIISTMMIKELNVLWCWSLLLCCVSGVQSQRSPYFLVTGMSRHLVNVCNFEFDSENDIFLDVQAVNTDCDSGEQNDLIVNTTWNFYSLTHDNDYIIDKSADISTTNNGTSFHLTPEQSHINIYAVQIIVKMIGDSGSHEYKLNGYLNIGCRYMTMKSQCRDNRYNIKSVDGNMLSPHELSSCSATKSVFKASSSVEFEVSTNNNEIVDYTENNMTEAGIYLKGQSSLVFELQTSRDAYISLYEDIIHHTINSTEVVLGGQANTISEIRSAGTSKAMHEEAGIVTDAEYRSFWITWATNKIRVGKGDLPYSNQIMSWDGISHDVNYISIGTANGASADWKFNVDICLQEPEENNEPSATGKQLTWYYNQATSSCVETSCSGKINCFTTFDTCNIVCLDDTSSLLAPVLVKVFAPTRKIRNAEQEESINNEAWSVVEEYAENKLEEIVLEISCNSNCNEEKNPQSSVEVYVVCDQCHSENITNYVWSVKDCDLQACPGSETNVTETGLSKIFNFRKEDNTIAIHYGIFVEVNFKDGRMANSSMLFKYSPEVSQGTCEVSPDFGYSLLTDFNITCTGFIVPEPYTLTYKIRSNVVDRFKTGSRLYKGSNSSVTNIKLPPGDPSNNYTLYILVKAKLESGSRAKYSTYIQVLPVDAKNDSNDSVLDIVKDLIVVTGDNETSMIDDLLHDNKTDEAVLYLGIISDNINTVAENDSDSVSEKTEIRTAVVSSLVMVTVDSYDTVSSLTSVLNQVTVQTNELSEETQDKVVDMYENLADNLDVFQNTSTAAELTDSVSDIISGVTNMLDLKTDTGSQTLTQAVNDDTQSKMNKVKEGTGKLLRTVDKVSGTLLTTKLAGQEPTVLVTDTMSVSVEKREAGTLSGHSVTSGIDSSTFEFPSDMSGIDSGNQNYGIQMINIKKNPYIWDTTSQGVNMDVLSMDLKAENGSVVKVENMNAPLTFTLAAPALSEPTNSSLIIHLIKNNSVIMFNQSESNFISFNFTVKPEITTVLELIPVSNIRKIKIHISDSIKPSFQNISNIGVLYPDELNAMNTELSDFKLTNLSAINVTNNYIYITYKNSSNTYSGVHYVGLTVDLIDNATLEDLRALDQDCIGNDTRTECETSVEIILKVKTKTLSCTYWDITLQQWKSDGCEVSPTSTDESLICLCTHMTSFAGGVFVLPNFIDPIADAELFLTFFENPVVVTTVIVVWMLYFFLINWARQADKKDEEKVGVIAVDSIDMEGHIYLMCVVTGWWSEAGTTSNVYFHINGTNGSSKKIKLSTSLRRCFQTGYEDWFIVSTEHNLGDIDNITLWHDNTGNSPHWYLSQLYLKDLKTKESWTFIYNDWLAVDRGHLLQTTATIAAINQHELKNLQKHNFMTKTTQDLRNTHLWISIFSKPARSTFTRAQRLTCALSLLLCNMLTNIMFYGVPTDNPEDQVSSAGGVSISLSAIVIGLQSSLIMFPVNIIIMQMFLKLKQKPLTNTSNEQNKSYIHELLNLVDTVSKSIMKKFVGRNEASSMFVINKSSSEKLESQGNYDTRVSWSSDLDYRSFHSAVSDPSLMSITSKLSDRSINTPSITVLSEEKQTGKSLPWWFLYIAWCLVLGISFVCSYFVMLYGLKYGYQKSIEWLVSFFTGFSQSALVTQPIKVLGVAIVFSFLFKKAVEFEDYGPEVRLDEDEDYKRSINDYIEPHIQFVQPLSTRLLQQIKDRIQLEWLMNVTLFDIGLYFIYMTVVCFVVHGQRDINKAYYNSLAIEDVLINPGCANPNNCFFLEKVDNVDTFYQYLYDVAIPNLIDMSTADHEYATPGSSHFLIGPWRLRQLRVEKGSCNDEERDLYDTFGAESHECSSFYWLGNEDNDDYNKSWSNVVHDVDNQAEPPTSWTYQSAWRLKTIPFSGRLATYSGGGYIVTMPSNSSLHEDTIDDIKYSDWIDERTRVVFLEFNLYNPNANLFSVVIILFEFSNTGAVIPYHQIYSTKLYHYSTDLGIVVAVCEGLFLAFNIMFIYIEWKKFSKLGRKEYFEDFWSYIEIIQIGLAFSVVGLFFQRLVFIDNIMKQFRESNEEKFVSFYTAISWDLILGYVMAFLVAVVTLKSAKLLRFNKRTYMIADALSHVKHMLVSVIVMAVLLFVAFSGFAMFAFGKLLPEYRDFLTSLITVFNLSLGVSDLPGLTEANRILGPIFYVIFVFFVMFIFMTIFMAIVDYGISESKSLLEHRQNKFELLEYVIRKIKVLANIR